MDLCGTTCILWLGAQRIRNISVRKQDTQAFTCPSTKLNGLCSREAGHFNFLPHWAVSWLVWGHMWPSRAFRRSFNKFVGRWEHNNFTGGEHVWGNTEKISKIKIIPSHSHRFPAIPPWIYHKQPYSRPGCILLEIFTSFLYCMRCMLTKEKLKFSNKEAPVTVQEVSYAADRFPIFSFTWQ